MEFASNPALCYKSKLIALLPVHITLSELLTNLDIYESPDDVVALIVAANNAQEELLRKIVCKIGIVRALYICDELCAPTVVSDIISLNIKLDRVLDFSIINHHTRFSKIAHYIDAYNLGYTPIIDSPVRACVADYDTIKEINNAMNNGLCISELHINIDSDCDYDILSDTNLAEIRHIILKQHGYQYDEYGLRHLLRRCNKIESISNNATELRTHVLFTEILPAVQNIKTISAPNITSKILKLCTNLIDVRVSDNIIISHATAFKLKVLDASISKVKAESYQNTIINDNCISICWHLKKLIATNNPRITTCAPFAKSLKILNASGLCGVNDDGLKLCSRIKALRITENSKITTFVPFTKTLNDLECGMVAIGEILRCTNLKRIVTSRVICRATCNLYMKKLKGYVII